MFDTSAVYPIGLTVEATRDLSYGIIPAGTRGRVIRTFTPAHAPGCWEVDVRWTLADGRTWDAGYTHGDPCLRRLDG